MQKIMIKLCFLSAILWAATAHAGLTYVDQEPIRSEVINEHVYSEALPVAPTPSVEFTAEEGENIARSARIESGKRTREADKIHTDSCFNEMREAAHDGKCSVTFFSEEAACNGEEEASGCYENKHFRRKLDRLGFKVRKREMPTAAQDDDCAAISVYWCVDRRRAR